MSNDRHCKLCEEPLPQLALAFSNSVAIEHGWCCWICMLSDLGNEKAYQVLGDKAKENQERRGKL